MGHFNAKKLVPLLALLFMLVLQGGLSGSACRAAEPQTIARYKVVGNTIVHTLTVPDPPPVAVLLVQHLPPGTVITAAEPAFSSYDKATGEVKWLLKEVTPGRMKIRLELANEVDKNTVSAEIAWANAAPTPSRLSP